MQTLTNIPHDLIITHAGVESRIQKGEARVKIHASSRWNHHHQPEIGHKALTHRDFTATGWTLGSSCEEATVGDSSKILRETTVTCSLSII